MTISFNDRDLLRVRKLKLNNPRTKPRIKRYISRKKIDPVILFIVIAYYITNSNHDMSISFNKIDYTNKLKEMMCPICFECYKEQDSIVKLECEHVYHDECITKWATYNLSCPICRKPIDEK